MDASIYIYNQRDGAQSHIGVPLYFPSITIIIGVPLPFLSMRGSTIGRPLYECHWLHKWCNLHSRVVIGQGPAARCSMHPWVYRPQNVEIGLHLLFEKYIAEWIRRTSSWNLLFNNYTVTESLVYINELISWSKNWKIIRLILVKNHGRLFFQKYTRLKKKKKKENTVERNLMYRNIHVNTIRVHGIDISSSTGGKYLA